MQEPSNAPGAFGPFLQATAVVDWREPGVMALARSLAGNAVGTHGSVKRCFEWVRDNIQHSSDFKRGPLTCSASEVLQHRTGFCYAKSHLLAALLRAHGIPTGFCYQRLSVDGIGAPFCLHGLNAVHLPEVGWYRLDPRGNRAGIDARFCPPVERLAFGIKIEGEADLPGVLPDPLPEVVNALHAHNSWEDLLHNLPDVQPQLWDVRKP
jgi:transglutaminase-like putative cysteine protease